MKNNPDKLSVSLWNIRGLTYDKLTDISDTNDYLPVDQDLNLDHDNFRNHKDKNEKSYGKLLSDLSITHSLKILNGRTIGDLTGKFTCFAYNGNSTVDLVLAENTVKQKVNYFKILPLTDWSDHCQLQSFQLKLDITIKTVKNETTTGQDKIQMGAHL